MKEKGQSVNLKKVTSKLKNYVRSRLSKIEHKKSVKTQMSNSLTILKARTGDLIDTNINKKRKQPYRSTRGEFLIGACSGLQTSLLITFIFTGYT